MNLAGVDLNLLIVFDALMAERHVTRAGERIGLSQPAMSAALNRLRHLLKDELFIRRADGMQPTRRAEELAIPLCQALQQIQDALKPKEFIAASASRVFKIATNDFAASLLLPSLGERIYKEAPNVDIRIIAADDTLAKNLIEQDGAEIAIAPFKQVEAQFEKQLLIEPVGFVCVMRKGHPLANLPLTLKAFAETPQLLISRTGDYKGFVDEILAELGYKRRVGFTVPNFLLAPIILKKTDYIATLPRRLVESIIDMSDLVSCEPPFPQRLFPLSMLWHRRLTKDPGHAWLRQTLVDIAASKGWLT
ncbi:transcriptional regulator LysR family protein [Calothrix sp. NIES-4071]|nr:transcriptional regulator LysR family protein [Calothrix sp. NIES-4071]BAZ60085.1 transcriptional regulator LysR family protein [Calothrix sp. NIES-4105]